MTDMDDLRIEAEAAEKYALRLARQLVDLMQMDERDGITVAFLVLRLDESLKDAKRLRRAHVAEVAG